MTTSKIDCSKYALFNSSEKSTDLPNVILRKSTVDDAKDLSQILFEREPKEQSIGECYNRFHLEFQKNTPDNWALFVAEFNGQVVGYGRLSLITNTTPNPYPKPKAWWLTGLGVKNDFRRKGIARKLTEKRIQFIQSKKEDLYYVSNSKNLASIKLHEHFGFKKVSEAPGYGSVSFDGGLGYLFQLKYTEQNL